MLDAIGAQDSRFSRANSCVCVSEYIAPARSKDKRALKGAMASNKDEDHAPRRRCSPTPLSLNFAAGRCDAMVHSRQPACSLARTHALSQCHVFHPLRRIDRPLFARSQPSRALDNQRRSISGRLRRVICPCGMQPSASPEMMVFETERCICVCARRLIDERRRY